MRSEHEYHAERIVKRHAVCWYVGNIEIAYFFRFFFPLTIYKKPLGSTVTSDLCRRQNQI